MLYRVLLPFKNKGRPIQIGTIVELDNKDEIKMLQGAKAIIEYSNGQIVETASLNIPEKRKRGRPKK